MCTRTLSCVLGTALGPTHHTASANDALLRTFTVTAYILPWCFGEVWLFWCPDRVRSPAFSCLFSWCHKVSSMELNQGLSGPPLCPVRLSLLSDRIHVSVHLCEGISFNFFSTSCLFCVKVNVILSLSLSHARTHMRALRKPPHLRHSSSPLSQFTWPFLSLLGTLLISLFLHQTQTCLGFWLSCSKMTSSDSSSLTELKPSQLVPSLVRTTIQSSGGSIRNQWKLMLKSFFPLKVRDTEACYQTVNSTAINPSKVGNRCVS